MKLSSSLLAAPLAALCLAGSASADGLDFSSMTDAERSAFREEVRAYLLENPDVIMEAVSILEQRQADQQVAADRTLVQDNLAALQDDGYSWVGGNPEGDVTIVEFLDYRCAYCRRAHPDVQKLLTSDGNIRYVLKEFPILGEASLTSTRFALAVRMIAGDETYKAASDALMELKADPSEPVLRRLASSLDVDADAVLAAMGDPAINEQIRKTRELAQKLQINGTPTFVFGGQMVRGYMPLDGMRSVIAQQRKEG